MALTDIIIQGAREHNLKNIDITIPRNKLVVITGLSGSGKSSLAFDTLYAEGQRRYVESLSAYARQFLEQMNKPDVDSIEGLSPAISIEQKTTSKNPRSTVGTVTEIYDYMRLLFARIGHPHCYACGNEIKAQSAQQIVDTVLGLPEKTKFSVLAPIVRDRKGEYKKEFAQLRKDGFVRVRVDGKQFELTDPIPLDKKKKHNIDVYIDRLVLNSKIRSRLNDSIEMALKLAEGLVKIEIIAGEELFFSEHFSCPDCGISYPKIEPRMFSFNSPHGACDNCDGLGHLRHFDEDLIVPDKNLSISEGAIAAWKSSASGGYYKTLLLTVIDACADDPTKPWKKLKKKTRDAILNGTKQELTYSFEGERSQYEYTAVFEGVVNNLGRRLRETDSDSMRDRLYRYMSPQDCPNCEGTRLCIESRNILIGKLGIQDLAAKTISDASHWINTLKIPKKEQQIAERIIKELQERLGFLVNVGLNYLSLDRTASTLSGGEGQRIRLATQIGSSLMGVIYILDEPSIGLHQKDNDRLIETLCNLRDLGNTVVVVEHDQDTIMAADKIIDIGPGAGIHGGEVVFQGTPKQIARASNSVTGLYISGRRKIGVPKHRRKSSGPEIKISGAHGHNLKNVSTAIPVGCFTCVTGVSGSGKSTLVIETLYKATMQALHDSRDKPAPHKAITGLDEIDKVIDIDQSPIGRTPRSNAATYTQVFGHIRNLFSELPDSKVRGYKPGRYSFNVKGGRCETCEGDGHLKIEMHFLPDVYVQCEDCQGKRYNRETLEVKYRGKNIADILAMPVTEALEFLSQIPAVKNILKTLDDVGLGYITLGQSATTLSGGEAQRIKLAKELAKRSTGRTLYILDEPTTGLHFVDIEKLLKVLDRLVEQGNTIVVIEHNLDVIKCADHIIDLGPKGGSQGGAIIATGTPEKIAGIKKSYTGQYLRRVLE